MIEPMVRNNICLNVHPAGCAAMVKNWIQETEESAAPAVKVSSGPKPKSVLVIGCSTGYGLASRIVSTFGYGVPTVGVSFERAPSEKKTGSPGWYDNRAFDAAAASRGIYSATIESDAFAKETKVQTIEAIRKGPGTVDLVIYSIASPVRTDPETGVMYRSVIKPIGRTYSGLTVDLVTGELKESYISTATQEEADATVKVMGGEDWKLWIDALAEAKVLARGVRTVAFSYIGPSLSHDIYREGTIGRAKEDLERTAVAIDRSLFPLGGHGWVSVNKAMSTRASAVIPGIGVYIAVLYRVMKEKGVHENCVGQIVRLFRDRLYSSGPVAVDTAGLIRIDDLEMASDIQRETTARMKKITAANLSQLADIDGVRSDFLEAHGFAVPGVDYSV
jgi:enoyl-[acyl-carrier protein] reductase / trans-2-enoyl-CoA reductase (NAD+)